MSCSDSELADRGRQARRLAQESYCPRAIFGFAYGSWNKLANDLHNACEKLLV